MEKIINSMIKLLEEHKVENVIAIDVSNRTPFATHYVLGTCLNGRQLTAMKDFVEEELNQNKLSIRAINGTAESGWIVIDEGTFMIHLFTKETRDQVSLEELLSK